MTRLTEADLHRIIRKAVAEALKEHVTTVANLPLVLNIYGPTDVDPLAQVEKAVRHLRRYLNFDRKPGDE